MKLRDYVQKSLKLDKVGVWLKIIGLGKQEMTTEKNLTTSSNNKISEQPWQFRIVCLAYRRGDQESCTEILQFETASLRIERHCDSSLLFVMNCATVTYQASRRQKILFISCICGFGLISERKMGEILVSGRGVLLVEKVGEGAKVREGRGYIINVESPHGQAPTEKWMTTVNCMRRAESCLDMRY